MEHEQYRECNQRPSAMTDFRREKLEIYKLHTELADRVSQRRSDANKIHVSLITGLAAVLVTLGRVGEGGLHQLTAVVIGCLGIALSVSWLIVIRSYRTLNSHKFNALHELEEELAYPFFTREWKLRDETKFLDRYWRLTIVETYLPILCLAMSLFLLVWGIRQ